MVVEKNEPNRLSAVSPSSAFAQALYIVLDTSLSDYTHISRKPDEEAYVH